MKELKKFRLKASAKTSKTPLNRASKKFFGFEFVKSELELGALRIDTLAFDNENKSFVIIEYKIDQSFSVID